MIPRYSRPEMAAIWAPETRFRLWFEIEALAAEAMAELGTIPGAAAAAIREGGARKLAAITPADLDRGDRARDAA
jgi:adenylosuccinate lyase